METTSLTHKMHQTALFLAFFLFVAIIIGFYVYIHTAGIFQSPILQVAEVCDVHHRQNTTLRDKKTPETLCDF